MKESEILCGSTKSVLLIGLSRTGTSLLQRLLNAHPRVFITYESIYRPFLGDNSWKDIHGYYYEVLKQHKHLCKAMDEQLSEVVKPFSFEKEFLYLGDKVIYNGSDEFRGRLRRALRTGRATKYIFVLRDPRARVLSFMKWIGDRDMAYTHTVKPSPPKDTRRIVIEQSQVWNTYVKDIIDYFGSDSRCCLVKYEELVITPKDCMNKILDFMELDRGMYSRHLLSTVSSGSTRRWREELDADSIAEVTRMTRTQLEELKYDLEDA